SLSLTMPRPHPLSPLFPYTTLFRSTHVLERADFRTDLFVFSNLSMDSLDYAGPRINEGGKGVLLGIGEPIRRLPRELNTIAGRTDRKSTRLNSSHLGISYAVFCLKK